MECKYCHTIFNEASLNPQPKIWWDDKGTESVKLLECPFCGKIQVIKYEPIHNLNYDKRYYK